MQLSRKEFLKTAALGATGVAVLGVSGMSFAESAAETAAAPVSGVFTATAQGFGGDVTVTLHLENSVLTLVEALGEKETAGIGSRAIELMPGTMVAKNSVEVDGVSGATFTSTAVLSAAAAALAESGAVLLSSDEEIVQSMKPGTYTGKAYGRWDESEALVEFFGGEKVTGPFEVAVTVDETSILSVEVLHASDLPYFQDICIERLPAAIVAEQSIAVDVVTGATFSSQAILNAAADALTQAGANLAGFNKPSPRVQDLEVYETDLVIIGAGAAGSSAALTAARNGIKAIVLEKCGKVGGNASCSTGMLSVESKYLIEEFGKERVSTKEQIFKEMMDWCTYRSDATIVKSFLANNGPAVDQLADAWLEIGFDGWVGALDIKNVKNAVRGTAKYQVLFDTIIKDAGIELFFETTAYELIMENGLIKGVKARRQNGAEIEIYCKDVVIASGGFAGNKEMLQEYFHTTDLCLVGVSTNCGEGLNMAISAGAALTLEITPNMAEFCSHPRMNFYDSYIQFINYSGLLQVNPTGARFYNEELGASDPLATGASALNTVGRAYVIFTQDNVDAMVENGCAGLLSEATRKSIVAYRDRACVPYYTLEMELKNAMDLGICFKADSLEELGALAGFDPEVYAETISTYKAAIEAGVDEEFGKRPEMLFPLNEGPFYALEIYPAFFGTLGGARVSPKMEALGQNLAPIPGLYMAGFDAGGMWSYPYFQTEHTIAMTMGFAITSGYIAVSSIAAKA